MGGPSLLQCLPIPFLCELSGSPRRNAEALTSAVNASGWRDHEGVQEQALLRTIALQNARSYDHGLQSLRQILRRLKIAHRETLEAAQSATIAAARSPIHSRSTDPSRHQASHSDSSCDEKLEMIECASEYAQVRVKSWGKLMRGGPYAPPC